MDHKKPLTVLESAFPFVYFTESFSDPKEFRNARIEFFKNEVGSQKVIGDPGIESHPQVEPFFRTLFKDPNQFECFLQEIENNGEIQGFEVALNEKFSFLNACQISSRITRLQRGEYFLQGYFVGIQRARESEKSLGVENQMLEAILSGIGDAVCVYDKNSRVLFQSPLHNRWFNDPTSNMCFKKAENGGKSFDLERPNRYVEKRIDGDNKTLSLEITNYPIKNHSGETFAGINIVRDISLMLELEEKSQELERYKQSKQKESAFRRIIGESHSLKLVLEAVNKISKLNTVVFIQGATGTGKELIARAIQELSPRAKKPFVTINCGALSETLLDSELFGHKKGAFTGAETETTGLFEAADGGTIFLDEIGEMSMGTQVKLLRVLQDGEIRKLGSTQSKKVNVRVITATHQDIEQLVALKKFREDLFYRIHVFAIHTPTLKERQDDVLILADHFLQEFSRIQHKEIHKISKGASLLLKEHSWPGNVRELRNVLERATILCDSDTLQEKDLPLTIVANGSPPEPPTSHPMKEYLDNPAKKKILEALERNRWNKSQTAKDLKISRATLWRKIKEFSIPSS